MRTGWVSSRGPYVDEFERRFSAYVRAKFGVASTSGTTALHLALSSLGVGPGDEVILPDCTMVACLDAVLYTGATPVLVDVTSDTFTLDPQELERAVTERTRVAMPVHLYGHPADMDPLARTAAARDFSLVEDAAEAHGAEYRGHRVGALGEAGCFSFFSNKIITTGEGGMVVTDRRRIADRARSLRDLAFSTERRDYRHDSVGFNYRLTNLQAALGLSQLDRIASFVRHRRECAHLYHDLLERVTGLTLPVEAPWARSVYWMYTVLVDDGAARRRRLIRALERKGIATRVAFWPLHRQPFVPADVGGGREFPNADRMGACGLSLPSGNGISLEMVRTVCTAISEGGW